MEIKYIYIENQKLVIITSSEEITQTMFLDKVCNIDNVHSEEASNHTKVITFEDFQKEEYGYSIDISDLDVSAIIFTENNNHRFAYNSKKLDEDIYKLLKFYCNTCLDKLQKERILMCSFRLSLFYNALSFNNSIEEIVSSYVDLMRLLDGLCHINNQNVECNTCKNGTCVYNKR